MRETGRLRLPSSPFVHFPLSLSLSLQFSLLLVVCGDFCVTVVPVTGLLAYRLNQLNAVAVDGIRSRQAAIWSTLAVCAPGLPPVVKFLNFEACP